MSTEIALHNTDLTTTPDQTFFTDKQIAALRQLGVEGASNGDLAVFFHVASRTGLDPFARQIYMISRKDKQKGVVQTIQTGIDGFRLTARRAADKRGESLEYEDNLWCGEDGVWRDVWLSPKPPRAAKAVVLRDGRRYPAIAHWDEYVQNKYDGGPNAFWSRGPAGQLAKCAEALALRKAFPLDLSGIYTDEEMGGRADSVQPRDPAAKPGDKLRRAVGLAIDAPAEPASRMITDDQVKALHTLYSKLGLTEREDKLEFSAAFLDLPELTTSRDLTFDQAHVLLDELSKRVEALDET